MTEAAVMQDPAVSNGRGEEPQSADNPLRHCKTKTEAIKLAIDAVSKNANCEPIDVSPASGCTWIENFTDVTGVTPNYFSGRKAAMFGPKASKKTGKKAATKKTPPSASASKSTAVATKKNVSCKLFDCEVARFIKANGEAAAIEEVKRIASILDA